MKNNLRINFLGAAGTVTGSKYLFKTKERKLLVDYGVFQGLKELRLLNWAKPDFDPAAIDAVMLTHGHLDHTGYLPRLVKLGFKGNIYGREPTLKISEIILNGSAKIQEEEAARANKEGYTRHHTAEPFYDLREFHQGWIYTNTRFTADAIQFGSCAGLMLVRWNYPRTGSLKDKIDSSGPHPITCLTTLTKSKKQKLLTMDKVLCMDLCNHPDLLNSIGIKNSKRQKIFFMRQMK